MNLATPCWSRHLRDAINLSRKPWHFRLCASCSRQALVVERGVALSGPKRVQGQGVGVPRLHLGVGLLYDAMDDCAPGATTAERNEEQRNNTALQPVFLSSFW